MTGHANKIEETCLLADDCSNHNKQSLNGLYWTKAIAGFVVLTKGADSYTKQKRIIFDMNS